jgi:low temperature requirement protein LtrA
LVTTALAGLILLFGIWWIYFAQPIEEHLRERRERSFLWGYGHYVVFAALAAVAAGLEVAVFLLGHLALQAYVAEHVHGAPIVALAAGLALLAAATAALWPIPVVLGLIALVAVALVGYKLAFEDAR